ncbi:hypothetical protein BU23DRAFT_636359 [Bimuria novae-zelandiae CBS 107.79]|uniref:Uncharacterized protein n=1 Tax=Bimuria novae-zelandiae CBS 107.79 TaxID=1447943 RepID=A0A6A5VCU4_9PLEO|nr:hypothetical protein BU23DRAFT_636359 [Bimuria novae-zelandiae CBS 107.79]
MSPIPQSQRTQSPPTPTSVDSAMEEHLDVAPWPPSSQDWNWDAHTIPPNRVHTRSLTPLPALPTPEHTAQPAPPSPHFEKLKKRWIYTRARQEGAEAGENGEGERGWKHRYMGEVEGLDDITEWLW